jgi:membrane protease YdiL (CAAX protease family)
VQELIAILLLLVVVAGHAVIFADLRSFLSFALLLLTACPLLIPKRPIFVTASSTKRGIFAVLLPVPLIVFIFGFAVLTRFRIGTTSSQPFLALLNIYAFWALPFLGMWLAGRMFGAKQLVLQFLATLWLLWVSFFFPFPIPGPEGLQVRIILYEWTGITLLVKVVPLYLALFWIEGIDLSLLGWKGKWGLDTVLVVTITSLVIILVICALSVPDAGYWIRHHNILSAFGFVALVGFNALAEEFVFRGWLFYYLGDITTRFPSSHTVTGNTGRVIISALTFGGVHLFSHNISTAFTATILGGILGFCYAKTKNLCAVVILHTVWNLLMLGTIS